jgi:hypothetical protein
VRYIDVRLRIPVTKMGLLIETLPEWATMVGYDKLAPVEARPTRKHGSTRNGAYKPGKGTAAEAVLRVTTTKPMQRFEIIAKLAGKQKEKAVSSAIHNLANKGLLVKKEGGAYARKN